MLPPTTYAEWLAALEYAGERPMNRDVLTALREGTLESGPTSVRLLVDRIVDFENVALRRMLRVLERNLAMLPADVRSDDVIVFVERFSRDCDDLVFFRHLGFMPEGCIDELTSSVSAQVAHVLGELIRHVDRNLNGGSDEIVIQIRRLRMRWLEGSRVGQLQ